MAPHAETLVPPVLRSADHVRHHRSLTAAAEKALLVWIAGRLPAWVTSDLLTAIGLVSMAGVGLSFWAAARFPVVALPLVVVFLALNWFGDSLDGTVARVRNQLRPRYGFYVDHVIDMAGTALLISGLMAGGFLSPVVGLAVLSAWLLVSAESFLATHARGVFRMSYGWFGPTELRILIALGALKLLRGSTVSPFGFGPWLAFDVGAVAAAAGMVVLFVAAGIRNGLALYREETTWR